MSKLQAYLEDRYLGKPKDGKKPKKAGKSKRDRQADDGLRIAADDAFDDWAKTDRQADEDGLIAAAGYGMDENGPVVWEGEAGAKKKKKTTGWKRVGHVQRDQDAADAILESVAHERAVDQHQDDDRPTVVQNDDDRVDDGDKNAARMSDGTRAGLQSAAELAAEQEKRRARERQHMEALRRDAATAETVYRDASGRRIDVAREHAAAEEAARVAAAEKERLAREALTGTVQREEARQRRAALAAAALQPLTRTADDADLNDHLRQQARWNDPMQQFMSTTTTTTAATKSGDRGPSSMKHRRRPVYAGPAAAPNRYQIQPGYRWDGVDRGNGFEARRFQALNQQKWRETREYEMQVDE